MSEREATGTRPSAYSRWHRTESLRRFVGYGDAYRASMVDVDSVEYCRDCGDILALVETAEGLHQTSKCAAVTTRIAKRLRVPCYIVLYASMGDGDVAALRVRRTAPTETQWTEVTPRFWAEQLVKLRRRHLCLPPDGAVTRGEDGTLLVRFEAEDEEDAVEMRQTMDRNWRRAALMTDAGGGDKE